MQRDKPKWRADKGAHALRTFKEIKLSIASLHDEDLLDLQDIFSESPTSALGIWASEEITRRNISA